MTNIPLVESTKENIVNDFSLKEILKNKRTFNNVWSIWSGMGWEIDWAETMNDGSVIKFR
jgi:predicted regulator of amino acid metabolism with ACT domain